MKPGNIYFKATAYWVFLCMEINDNTIEFFDKSWQGYGKLPFRQEIWRKQPKFLVYAAGKFYVNYCGGLDCIKII